ncbi:hypothetical protein BHE74_00056970 [Ensete ventricosum]|nr:hypothetical protein BHE74_00056970 [Ensete ventricosum]
MPIYCRFYPSVSYLTLLSPLQASEQISHAPFTPHHHLLLHHHHPLLSLAFKPYSFFSQFLSVPCGGMAAALECWSGRPSTDEDTVEQVLMQTQDRSEAFHRSSATAASSASPACNSSSASSSSSSSTSSSPPSPSAALPPPKKWQRLGRNFAGAIAALRSSLNIDPSRDPSPSRFDRLLRGVGLARNPGGLPSDKLVSSVRRHFDSLPNRCSASAVAFFPHFFLPLMVPFE